MKDRSHSWWWDSHISPKNSKWLQESLLDMDAKVSAMLKLIEEDADSFAKRAEMYYKKRPELVKLVEEFYRSYRSLAERYDNLTGAICKNVSKPLISSQSSDESSIGKHIYDNGRLVHIELPSEFNFSHSKGDGSELEDREDSDTSTTSNSKLDQACETEKETTFASTSDSASSSISDSGYEATNKMHSRNAASNINVNESSQNLEVGNTEVSSTVQDQIPPTGKGHAHYASRIDELQCNLSHLQLENINLQDLAVTRLNEITRLKELYCSIQDENKALKDDISFSLQQITVLQRALHGIDVKGENAMRQGMAGFGKDSGNGLKGAKSGETIKLVDALMKVSDDLFHLQETYQHEILAKDSLNRNLETRIINLQQEMDNFQENLNRLEKENCDLRKVIQNKENIIQKHQEDITMLESLQLNLEASHQAEKLMTELQTRIEKVQEENLNLKSEVGRLKSQYLGSFERMEKENRGLQQLNKRWIGELRKIKGLYDADLTMVKDLLAEMMYFQKQCEALQKEMNGGITYAKELENDILSLKIEKDLLKDDFTWLLYKFREDLSRLLRTKMDLEKALQYEALETHSQGEELKKLQKQLACLQESKTHTDAKYVDELQLAKVQVKELQQEICLLRQKNSECLNRAIHVLPAEDESHAANLDAQLDYPISEDELQQEILNEEKKVMGNLLSITKRMCKLEERVSVLQQEKENVVRSLEARDRQAKHLFVALRSMKKEVTDVVEKTIHLRETTAARFERKWSMR